MPRSLRRLLCMHAALECFASRVHSITREISRPNERALAEVRIGNERAIDRCFETSQIKQFRKVTVIKVLVARRTEGHEIPRVGFPSYGMRPYVLQRKVFSFAA